ncbi:MAG: response regulator, partial [Candidatus Dadabacteria bacterium]
RLAGGIAHDFNNTLVIIIGYTELLLTRLPDDAPFRQELLEIRSAAQRAEALTAQLLAIGRHDTGQQVDFEIGQLLERLHGTLQRIIGEEITIALEPPDSPLALHGDRERLLQALLNLIINARDAMPDGGMLTIRARQEVRDGLDGARIDIADTGTGIPEDIRERIFEPFFTTKPAGKGSGLGLALVYTTVRQAGGTIEVQSRAGEGTTFSIWLPLADGHATDQGQAERPAGQAPPSAELTILLVEDHPDVRQILAESLRELHHKVLKADSAAAAREIWSEHKDDIDLLITDIIMPNERGTILARDLLADRAELPVILISGYTNEVLDSDLAMRTVFLQKPFDASDLAAAIRRAVPSILRS